YHLDTKKKSQVLTLSFHFFSYIVTIFGVFFFQFSTSFMDIHVRVDLRDRGQHIQLKKDLVEHIWQKFRATLS
ncbi:unnamed protein product, partial [Arabidopsis halleri]